MPIQVLDQDTINKIAAGEVVERPSSVVKELVENAIDAKATAITIEIKDGGISFIRITDNGCGIDGKEIPTAFLRHSTSKIKSIEDLTYVSSLGFRGEALSSIASVSQIELITKNKDDFNGNRYIIEGGEEKIFEEIGAPEGTTFIIRNLFYNTPVRRKFLKTPATEAGYVNALVEHLALSHPDVSFRFINNNQNKLHTSGNSNLRDIVYHVYGRDISNNLIVIKDKTQDITIEGFIGKPAISRGNRTYENYYINGRYIKSNIITKAIEEAYKGFIMLHNYPFTAMHFKINSEILDVNVHPTKMELRFSQNEFVYNFVMNSVRAALTRRELIPNVEIGKTVQEKSRNRQFVAVDHTKSNVNPAEVLVDNTIKTTGTPDINNIQFLEEKTGAAPSAEEVKPKNPIKERLPEPFEVKRSEQFLKDESRLDTYGSDIEIGKKVINNSVNEELDHELTKSKEIVSKIVNNQDEHTKPQLGSDSSLNTASEPIQAEQMSIFDEDDRLLDKKHEKQIRIIGQLFDTYWLMEYEDKFYMMDQHAAHEKMLFETTMKSLQEQKMDSQMVMPPVILSLNMREQQVLLEHMDVFKRLGYEIEEFGGKEYKVTGIPANLPSIDTNRLLIDILDGLVDENMSKNTEIITEKIASMSCKAAVKGNNKLSENEANELMNELMQAENPYNCPHGRPTLIAMTKYEIEKKFKRIV